LVPGRDRIGFYGDTFAQQIEGRGNALRSQVSSRTNRLLDGLSRDEPRGELTGETIPTNEVENPALL
jgi:hypothetical protein